MRLKLLACSLLFAASSVLPVQAADYITTAPAEVYAQQPTVCAKSGVLGVIDRNFDYRDSHYLHANLDVVSLQDPRELYERPSDSTHLVGRTYCEATAIMNDNRPRRVWYLIETTMGFAGIGDNVEYCIAGLDPWHVYGAHCSTVRP